MPARLCRAIARSAVQKQPERRARMFLCSPAAEQAAMGGGSNLAPPPTGYAAQSREARCKNSRSAERGCSSVPPPPNRRRMGGGNNPAPPPTGYAAQSRKARCKKQPERRALRPQARFGAQPPQAALGAEIGCSSVHPPPNRRRMGGGSNLALALGGEGLTLPHCQQPIAAPGNHLTHNHATPHQKEGQPC